MNSYASEINGSQGFSTQEMQQLLQQVAAKPIEQAKKIADVNAVMQAQEQKMQELGKGEIVDLFA